MSSSNSSTTTTTEDEEVINPRILLESKYSPQCHHEWSEYEACANRIKSLPEPKPCSGWYNNYWKCVDDKVTKKNQDL